VKLRVNIRMLHGVFDVVEAASYFVNCLCFILGDRTLNPLPFLPMVVELHWIFVTRNVS